MYIQLRNIIKNRELKNAFIGFFKFIPDKRFIKIAYYLRMGKRLDLDNPKTFNEKIQWTKLYDRQPIYVDMVDKYEAKKYAGEIIGNEHIIPLIGVWDKFEDIDFDKLPSQFVLKCTHDSGGLVIVKDKASMDKEKARKIINRSLKTNYFWIAREWVYRKIKPRIIAEEYMQDGENTTLPVYKFFCFDGKPRIIQTIQNDKQPNESIDYFDINWNLLGFKQNFPNSEHPYEKPENLEAMLTMAEKLSAKKRGFVRIDIFTANGKLYFSEFTLYSDAGLAPFDPPEWDKTLGEWLNLPNN